MLELLVVKFIVVLVTVLALSLISETIGPKMAGFVSGLPTGTAIALFFFGFEHGPEFASQSAVSNMSGMLALQVFLFIYYLSSAHFRRYTLLFSSILSIAGYVLAIMVLQWLQLSAIVATFAVAISIPLFIYLYKPIANNTIKKAAPLSFQAFLFRAIFAASILLPVTFFAPILGPGWAGLFSAFPSTLFPLILIIHSTYESKHVHTIIKNVPQGIFAVVIYGWGVFYFYPMLGVYVGTAAAYLLVLLYSLLYFLLVEKRPLLA